MVVVKIKKLKYVRPGGQYPVYSGQYIMFAIIVRVSGIMSCLGHFI